MLCHAMTRLNLKFATSPKLLKLESAEEYQWVRPRLLLSKASRWLDHHQNLQCVQIDVNHVETHRHRRSRNRQH